MSAPPPSPPSTPPTAPPQQPWPTAPWPHAPWSPTAWPPRPNRTEFSWPILSGGVLVFLGYTLFALGDVLFLRLPSNPTSEQYFAVASIFIVGEAILGLGFLVALIGLALKR